MRNPSPAGTTQAPFLAHLAIAICTLIVSGAPCTAFDLTLPPAPPTERAITQLPDVNVRGQRNAFQESDRRLKTLIERSTPCLGCDAARPEIPPSTGAQALNLAVYLLTPQESQPIDTDDTLQYELDRAAFEKRLPSNRNP